MNPLTFRCHHRHNGISHPKCYLDFLQGKAKPRTAKILLLDIETLPGEWYAFDARTEYLGADKMIKDWSIACWAAKWLFDTEIRGQTVTPKEAYNRTEESIIQGIWNLMDEADIVITQNGNRFDLPKLNSKFLKYRLSPPSHYLTVDTLLTARSQFGNTYNNLNELAKWLGLDVQKTKMTFDDWKACLSNDKGAKEALEHMLDYCKRDVAPLLEDVYLILLPYIKNHPNLGIFADHDTDVCPKCESQDLYWDGSTYKTATGLWEAFRCVKCGAIGRGRNKTKHQIRKVEVS